MATVTFSTLPAETHVGIAENCEKGDLINLCLTSRWVNERYLHVLYRYVDLPNDPKLLGFGDLLERQQQLVRTLLSHPDYGKLVRFLRGTLCVPNVDDCHSLGQAVFSENCLWRALQSLTHVQSVSIAFEKTSFYEVRAPATQLPTALFQSATSVKLVGHMPYGLAKSILNAINPAALKHLYLMMVHDIVRAIDFNEMGEYGRLRARGVVSGLLTTLTGHCTALQTLILRREGQSQDNYGWYTAADEASYVEWASFIRSVQGTVAKFIFEQIDNGSPHISSVFQQTPFRVMDERFQRLLFPAIVSGNWPCLTIMELRGVGGSNSQGGQAALMMNLRALLGEDTKIVVEEEVLKGYDFQQEQDLFCRD